MSQLALPHLKLYEQTVRTEAAKNARDEASEEASRRKAQEDFIELSSDDDEENGDKNDRGDDEKKTNTCVRNMCNM